MKVDITNEIITVDVGALADEPAGIILEKIKTVDGTGSGLDADRLRTKTVADFASNSLDNVQELPNNLFNAIKVDGGYF